MISDSYYTDKNCETIVPKESSPNFAYNIKQIN